MADNDLTKVDHSSITSPVKEENVKIVYVHHNDPPVEDFWAALGKAFYEADPKMWEDFAKSKKKGKKRKARK